MLRKRAALLIPLLLMLLNVLPSGRPTATALEKPETIAVVPSTEAGAALQGEEPPGYPSPWEAIQAALEQHQRIHDLAGHIDLDEPVVHGDRAYAVGYPTDSAGRRIPQAFVVFLAHRDSTVGWNAVAPGAVTAREYNAWLDAFPLSILDGSTKAFLSRPEPYLGSPGLTGHKLPWPAGQAGTVAKKDNCACRGGCAGTGHENQVDFTLPGDVFASKPGTVVFVKESSNRGCCAFRCWRQANMVVIRHGASEYSWYVHLAHNSVPVSVGDAVGFGAKLGVEGDTGYACGAHLHYMAATGHYAWTDPGDPDAAPWAMGITTVDFAEVSWADLTVCAEYTSQNSDGSDRPPDPPTRIDPPDRAILPYGTDITLGWESCEDCTAYQAHFWDGSGIDIHSARIAAPNWHIGPLRPGTYQWAIRARNENGDGPWSASPWAFTVPEPPGPLVYDSHTVDDDPSGHSSGNGDGVVDCGETIELYVNICNGSATATTGVTATISTRDFYVVWSQNTISSYPDMPGGGTGANTNAFDLTVDPSTLDGHLLHFDLDITASHGGPWSAGFDVPVTCISDDSHYTFVPLIVRNR